MMYLHNSMAEAAHNELDLRRPMVGARTSVGAAVESRGVWGGGV